MENLYLAGAAGINSGTFEEVGKIFQKDTQSGSPARAADLGALLLFAVNFLLIAVATIAVIFLMLGGYRYIMARGNEEASEAAKKTIANSVLGLIIVVLAFVIVRIVIRILTEGQGAVGI